MKSRKEIVTPQLLEDIHEAFLAKYPLQQYDTPGWSKQTKRILFHPNTKVALKHIHSAAKGEVPIPMLCGVLFYCVNYATRRDWRSKNPSLTTSEREEMKNLSASIRRARKLVAGQIRDIHAMYNMPKDTPLLDSLDKVAGFLQFKAEHDFVPHRRKDIQLDLMFHFLARDFEAMVGSQLPSVIAKLAEVATGEKWTTDKVYKRLARTPDHIKHWVRYIAASYGKKGVALRPRK